MPPTSSSSFSSAVEAVAPRTPPVRLPHLGRRVEDDDRAPRRLVRLDGGLLAAYGGNDGVVCASRNDDGGWRVGRRFDDPVRAVAASDDGTRVMVGHEDGSTEVFVLDPTRGDSFLNLGDEARTKDDDDDDDDDDDLLATQDEDDDDGGRTTPDVANTTLPSFRGPRAAAPVRDLAFRPGTHLVAVASEEGLCVVDASSEERFIEVGRILEKEAATHHDGSGVRAAVWSRDGTRLASLGMDGRLCVWETEGTDDPRMEWDLLKRDAVPRVTRRDVGELNGATAADRACRPAAGTTRWALPGATDPRVRAVRGDAEEEDVVWTAGNHHGHSDAIVCAAWDEAGERLATAGRDGRVLLWGGAGSLLGELSYEKSDKGGEAAPFPSRPTCVEWKGDEVRVVTENGELSTYSGADIRALVVRTSEDDVDATVAMVPDTQDDEGLDTQPLTQPSQSPPPKESRKRLSTQRDEQDDDDDDDVFAESDANRNATPSKMFLDEAEEDVKHDKDDHKNDDKDKTSATDLDLEDERLMNEFRNEGARNDDDPYGEDDDALSVRSQPPHVAAVQKVRLLPPFPPAATPFADGRRRILCWNHLGVVSHRREDDHHNVVDIEFSDATDARRRPVSFPESDHFIVGTLGDDGAFFATDAAEDRGARLFFHRHDTFGALRDKDWRVELHRGERAVGLATGRGWAAAVTSNRLLRVFSSAGVQSHVSWLPGPPVTTVGRDRVLVVWYHVGDPDLEGRPRLGVSVHVVADGGDLVSVERGTHDPPATLAWVGVGADAAPYSVGDDGVLSSRRSDGVWCPVLDTTAHAKSTGDSFWPVAVANGRLTCVPLKGGRAFPDVGRRRPTTMSLPLRVPAARRGVFSGAAERLEETWLRASSSLRQAAVVRDREIRETPASREESEADHERYRTNVDKLTLKLFFEAVRANRAEIALDLVGRLLKEKSHDVALKASDRLGRDRLSDEIEAARRRRFPPPEEDEDEDDDEDAFEVDDEQEEDRGSYHDRQHREDDGARTPTGGGAPSRNVSPEGGGGAVEDSSKRPREEEEDDDDGVAPACTPVRRRKKLRNPFAKRATVTGDPGTVLSPVRPPQAPTTDLPNDDDDEEKRQKQQKQRLSRQSTFGALARFEAKRGKRIL